MDQPIAIVGGSISLVSIIGVLLKFWLTGLERRQMDRDEKQKERDIETKSQLAAIFKETTRMGRALAALETRLAVVEREVERLERTPSGRFRIRVSGEESDE